MHEVLQARHGGHAPRLSLPLASPIEGKMLLFPMIFLREPMLGKRCMGILQSKGFLQSACNTTLVL